MASDSCSTCATLLSDDAPAYSQHDEEPPLPRGRRVECCRRIICAKCIQGNKRFAQYCPYCQVSNVPSPLPQGLKEPPAYESAISTSSSTTTTTTSSMASVPATAPPPPYAAPHDPSVEHDKAALAAAQRDPKPAQDIVHFLHHQHDTITSLSLKYGVPASVLRRLNNVTSDHLLAGRRTVLIPAEYYKAAVSLSPRPVHGEEEELRKGKIRRFMTSCKVSNYDIAVLYLEQAGYDTGVAVGAYFDDERWEKDHPVALGAASSKAAKSHENRGPFWRRLF